MSDSTGTPHDPAPARSQESIDRVTVRRAPRYYRFMAIGAVVGVIVAAVLTFAFPDHEDFSRLQVFGFTGIFLVAVFVALAALVAILIDRVSRRRAREVAVQHREEHAAPAPDAATPARADATAPDAAAAATTSTPAQTTETAAPAQATETPQNDEKA